VSAAREPEPSSSRLVIAGSYSDHDLYQRNRVLVELCREAYPDAAIVRPRQRRDLPPRGALRRIIYLLRSALSVALQRSVLSTADILFVPYPAYLDLCLLWASRALAGRRVVADAFLDLRSTVVDDRRLLRSGSLPARLLLAVERFALSRADVVLIDTPEQAALLRERLAGSDTQVAVVPVGIDEKQWTALPAPVPGDTLRCLFWGTFIPLHGVPVIVAAARELAARGAPVRIDVIGDGQMAAAVARDLEQASPPNLHWRRELVDTATLRRSVAVADVILGVFGESAKAAAVVPYKLYQSLASDRPVITRSSPAVAAIADADSGLFTVPAGDAAALADTLQAVHAKLRGGWRCTTRQLYERHLSQGVVAAALAAALEGDRMSP
jgi:glycosyltransferase involved in cell wall biosynthesis